MFYLSRFKKLVEGFIVFESIKYSGNFENRDLSYPTLVSRFDLDVSFWSIVDAYRFLYLKIRSGL